LTKNPVIGITLGDPGGIGPEILLKALRKRIPGGSFLIIGSSRVLEHHARRLSIPFSRHQIQIIDIDNVPKPYFGARPEISGKASIEYLDTAFRYFEKGKIQGLVTGPIQKESWHLSGYHYAGQTEYCAMRTGSKEYCMLMAGELLRIAVLSTHLSLAEALQQVTQESIAENRMRRTESARRRKWSIRQRRSCGN
jgi:4-hydroxythreonine-4-phosphate dehydrogenase